MGWAPLYLDGHFHMLVNGKVTTEVMEVTGMFNKSLGAGSHSKKTVRHGS